LLQGDFNFSQGGCVGGVESFSTERVERNLLQRLGSSVGSLAQTC